jgi:hypothetical protein
VSATHDSTASCAEREARTLAGGALSRIVALTRGSWSGAPSSYVSTRATDSIRTAVPRCLTRIRSASTSWTPTGRRRRLTTETWICANSVNGRRGNNVGLSLHGIARAEGGDETDSSFSPRRRFVLALRRSAPVLRKHSASSPEIEHLLALPRMNRPTRARQFGLLLLLVGCHSGSERASRTAEPELVIPELPRDAGTHSASPVAATRATASSSGGGWIVRPEHGTMPSYTERTLVLAAIKKAPSRAILQHDDHIEDCSSVGGAHDFFTPLEPGSGLAYYGGHGTHLPHAFTKGTFYLASIEVLARPTSVKNRTFCIPNRTITMRITAIVPLASAEEGVELMDAMAKP